MWTKPITFYLCIRLGPHRNPITITPKLLITITFSNSACYLIVNNPVIWLSVMPLTKFYSDNYFI